MDTDSCKATQVSGSCWQRGRLGTRKELHWGEKLDQGGPPGKGPPAGPGVQEGEGPARGGGVAPSAGPMDGRAGVPRAALCPAHPARPTAHSQPLGWAVLGLLPAALPAFLNLAPCIGLPPSRHQCQPFLVGTPLVGRTGGPPAPVFLWSQAWQMHPLPDAFGSRAESRGQGSGDLRGAPGLRGQRAVGVQGGETEGMTPKQSSLLDGGIWVLVSLGHLPNFTVFYESVC